MTARRVAARESRDHARRAARLHQDRRQGTQVRHSVRRRRARRADRAPTCRTSTLVGLDMHLGSQLSRIDPYREGTERLASIFAELTQARHHGRSSTSTSAAGSACATTPSSRRTSQRFAELVLPTVAETGLKLIMEPGRFIVGNAGVLRRRGAVPEAQRRKGLRRRRRGDDRAAAAVALRRVSSQSTRCGERGNTQRVDVVGPVCESGDFLALDRELDDVQPGEYLVVCDVGAYGYAMASNYNSRLRPAEVLVDGDRFAVITAREQYDDLARLRDRRARVEAGEAQLMRDRTDRGHARPPAGHRRVGAADAGRRRRHGAARRRLLLAVLAQAVRGGADLARRRVRPERRRPRRDWSSRAQSAFGIELFESPHSFEIGGRRILLVHDIGDVQKRSVLGARDRGARPHASAGDEDARRDADRQSRAKACGWLYGTPSAAILDLDSRAASSS